MKIYKPPKHELIRLTIKHKAETEYINLIETKHDLVIKYVIKHFSSYMVKSSKDKTTIDIRHCIGGENLKSQRVSLYGINQKEIFETLTKLLEKH